MWRTWGAWPTASGLAVSFRVLTPFSQTPHHRQTYPPKLSPHSREILRSEDAVPRERHTW